ncbi:MAG: hypothetical protein IPH53_20275 [Flavobacteriales bacterium]|nr:hypothetical protein [Flavobacteriales bacterium]
MSTTTDPVHLKDITPPQHDALPDTMELEIEYGMPQCHAHIPDLLSF